MCYLAGGITTISPVSVLFNEPKLLKWWCAIAQMRAREVSVLFNEPKLLKFWLYAAKCGCSIGFSALQRAKIAEIVSAMFRHSLPREFQCSSTSRNCWNSLKSIYCRACQQVSVLFNEPKLLKLSVVCIFKAWLSMFQCSSTSRNCWNVWGVVYDAADPDCFSALQRAEIAEMVTSMLISSSILKFQCSSTSRNCWNDDEVLL